MQLSFEEIKKILPHRYPFLLIDKVLEVEADKRIKAIKNVSGNEPFFQGHFPHNAVMPGVLIIEAMAQAGAVCLLVEREVKGTLVFAGIEKAKFRKPVVPGDTITFEVEVLNLKKKFCKLKGRALVDGTMVAEATFSSALAEM